MDKYIVGGIAIVAVMILVALFGAFTISTLWSWFIVPFGVQSITMAHAYGLGLMASLLQGVRGLNNQEGSGMILFQGVMLNIITLIFGGIAVQFM